MIIPSPLFKSGDKVSGLLYGQRVAFIVDDVFFDYNKRGWVYPNMELDWEGDWETINYHEHQLELL